MRVGATSSIGSLEIRNSVKFGYSPNLKKDTRVPNLRSKIRQYVQIFSDIRRPLMQTTAQTTGQTSGGGGRARDGGGSYLHQQDLMIIPHGDSHLSWYQVDPAMLLHSSCPWPAPGPFLRLTFSCSTPASAQILLLPMKFCMKVKKIKCICPAPTLLPPCYCPAPALLLLCSYPAPSQLQLLPCSRHTLFLLLPSSYPARAQLLTYFCPVLLHPVQFCSCPALALLLPCYCPDLALLLPYSWFCPPQFGSFHYHQHHSTFFGTARAVFYGKVAMALT